MDLNLLWFVLLGVLLAGYAILDGFDLGVGILHLAVRNEKDRRLTINAIGPLWDGNEVWLVTFGGAMFAAFPNAYATVFSGFYVAFMLLLFALIFRAVSMEFRGQTGFPRMEALLGLCVFWLQLAGYVSFRCGGRQRPGRDSGGRQWYVYRLFL